MIRSRITTNFEAGKGIKVSHSSQGVTRTDLGDELGTAYLHLGDKVIVTITHMGTSTIPNWNTRHTFDSPIANGLYEA